MISAYIYVSNMEMSIAGTVFLAKEALDDVTVIDCGSTDRSRHITDMIEGVRTFYLSEGSDYLDFMTRSISDAGKRRSERAYFFPGNGEFDPSIIPDTERFIKQNRCDILLIYKNNKKTGFRGRMKKNLFSPASDGEQPVFDDLGDRFRAPRTPFRCYSRKALLKAVLDKERKIQSFDDIETLSIKEYEMK